MSTTINKITIPKKLTWPIIIFIIFIVGFVIVPNVSTPTKQAEAQIPAEASFEDKKAEIEKEKERIQTEAKRLELEKQIKQKELEKLELEKAKTELDPKV